jgi:hypothetical protein
VFIALQALQQLISIDLAVLPTVNLLRKENVLLIQKKLLTIIKAYTWLEHFPKLAKWLPI